MLGQYKLQTIIQRGPMLKGLDGGRTQAGCPLTELIQRSEIIEKDETNNVIIISICAGFSAADIYDIGPSITVTLNVRDTPNIGIISTYYWFRPQCYLSHTARFRSAKS